MRLQRDQRRARLRQPVPAPGSTSRQVGLQRICGFRLRRRASIFIRVIITNPTQAQASAISVQRGMDNECADISSKVKRDERLQVRISRPFSRGYLKESEIDTALIRLFTARMKLGMFDPPDMVPYNKIDESQLNSAENRDLARKIADESMVLLKNDGTLPLKTSGIKIAVIGPLADQTRVLLGNYNGTPTHTVSILEGLRKEFAGANIQYVPGTQFLRHEADPVPASALTVNGKPGIRASYSKLDVSDVNHLKIMTPVALRVDPTINAAAEPLPPEAADLHPLTISWDGSLTAPETGDYNLGLKANGIFRVRLMARMSLPPTGATPTKPSLAECISRPASRLRFMLSTRHLRTVRPTPGWSGRSRISGRNPRRLPQQRTPTW